MFCSLLSLFRSDFPVKGHPYTFAMPAIFRWADFLKSSDGWRFTKATTAGIHYVQVSPKFNIILELGFPPGRCPPLQSLVPAECVVEGVDSDDEHPQLDKVLQPQPQAGGVGQAAGAPPCVGKPPELEEEDGPCFVGEGPRPKVALVVGMQPI